MVSISAVDPLLLIESSLSSVLGSAPLAVCCLSVCPPVSPFHPFSIPYFHCFNQSSCNTYYHTRPPPMVFSLSPVFFLLPLGCCCSSHVFAIATRASQFNGCQPKGFFFFDWSLLCHSKNQTGFISTLTPLPLFALLFCVVIVVVIRQWHMRMCGWSVLESFLRSCAAFRLLYHACA